MKTSEYQCLSKGWNVYPHNRPQVNQIIPNRQNISQLVMHFERVSQGLGYSCKSLLRPSKGLGQPLISTPQKISLESSRNNHAHGQIQVKLSTVKAN